MDDSTPDPQPIALPAALAGARIQEVRQPAPDEIVLGMHGPGGTSHWLLSAAPAAARFIQTFASGKNAPQPGQFLLWLRTRLEGAKVTGFAVHRGQIADLAMHGKGGAFDLVLEMNGHESNLLLLDAGRHALAALHPRAGDGEGPYAPPEKLHRYSKADPPRLPVPDAREAKVLDARWREHAAQQAFQAARGEALRRAKAALAKVRRRLANIEGDHAAAQGADGVREQAELLQIHRNELKPGMVEIIVPNEFLPERPAVRIPLDPSLGAGENIERLFQRYRKQRDSATHVARRLAQTRQEAARWEQLLAQLEAAGAPAALDALLATLSPGERALLTPRQPGKFAHPEPRGVMTRVSADGYTIYVGRSKTENDKVTFRIGRGRDWWLHALGVPGAHVLVRNPNDAPLPPRTLRQAAWLAAYYSKGRAQTALEVTCTQRKHVRKVKGGEPGQVTHALGRTVWVTLDDAQARGILGEGDPGDLDV